MRAAPLAVALALAVAGGACGRKTQVIAPQLVAPQAIEKLEAQNETIGIRLRWERPRDYVNGTRMNDLAAFRIERRRAGEEDFGVLEYVEVEDRHRFQQVRHFRYLDVSAEVGGSYAYRVFCFTLDGHQSAASNLVEITRALPRAAAAQESVPSP